MEPRQFIQEFIAAFVKSQERPYSITSQSFGRSQPIDAKGCNGIMFTNEGTTDAMINNKLLAPGATLSYNGHPGERDFSDYKILFPDGSSVDNKVSVEWKFYIDPTSKEVSG